MNADVLIQHVINLFLVAIVIEMALSAVFTLSALANYNTNTKPFRSARDIITLLIALFFCYNFKTFKIFRGTGVKLPQLIDTIISALVLSRLAFFVRDLSARIKRGD
jgi:hypothetical protein